MNDPAKARKPKSSFPKVRARSKRRKHEATPVASVTLRADQPFRVVERKTGGGAGVVAFHVITRDGHAHDADVSLLGQFDFRKLKRGK